MIEPEQPVETLRDPSDGTGSGLEREQAGATDVALERAIGDSWAAVIVEAIAAAAARTGGAGSAGTGATAVLVDTNLERDDVVAGTAAGHDVAEPGHPLFEQVEVLGRHDEGGGPRVDARLAAAAAADAQHAPVALAPLEHRQHLLVDEALPQVLLRPAAVGRQPAGVA